MVRQIVDRVSTVVREEGPSVALTKIVRGAVRFFHGHRTDDFDAAFKIDTWKEVPLWRLQVPSENASFGSKYQTTDPSVFLNAIRQVPADHREFTFIDLGCGKGRTLILAAQEGFRKVIGVEFSAELAAVAKQNLRQLGLDAEVMEADASKFQFVDGDLLIYMYNPFGKSVMLDVIENLAQWRRRYSRRAFVVYINPVCRGEFDSSPLLQSLVRTPDLGIWKVL